jgi:hypothetical protein
VLLQLADVIMGAVSYHLNNKEKKVTAKLKLIERIKQNSNQNLENSSLYVQTKMNLFFIDLK